MNIPSDFKRYRKLSSDNKTTTVLHPQGHKIMIAHDAISESTRKKLKEMPVHMAEGGMTSEDPNADVTQGKIPGVNININASPQPKASMPPPPPALSYPTPGPSPDVMPPPPMEQAAAPSPGLAPVQKAPPEPEQPTPQIPSDAFGYGAQAGLLAQGFNQQQKGLFDEARAQGKLGNEEAALLNTQEGRLQERANHYENNFNELMRERDAIQKDYMSKHIDPNRLYNSQSTPQRILTGIGLILGGAHAVDYLNKQIDRDIEAQKADIGTGNSLLKANMEQFGNLRDATNMTKVIMSDLAATQLKEAAAKATDPIAKARALQAAGQLTMQSAPMIQQLAAMKALSGSNISPEQKIGLIPKEDHKAAREELSMINGYQETDKSITDDFEKMRGIGGIAGNLPFSGTKAQAQTIRAKIVSKIRSSMKGQGALSDQEVEQSINPLLPSPSDTVTQLNQKEIALKDILRNKIQGGTPILNQYRINPLGGGPTAGGPINFKPLKAK